MRYIAPKDAVVHMLRTGDKSVLAKVDPARKNELMSALKHAQAELQRRAQVQKNQYAELVKRVAAKERTEHTAAPHRRGIEEWPTGQSYSDLRKAKPKVVRFDPNNATAADVSSLLAGLGRE